MATSDETRRNAEDNPECITPTASTITARSGTLCRPDLVTVTRQNVVCQLLCQGAVCGTNHRAAVPFQRGYLDVLGATGACQPVRSPRIVGSIVKGVNSEAVTFRSQAPKVASPERTTSEQTRGFAERRVSGQIGYFRQATRRRLGYGARVHAR